MTDPIGSCDCDICHGKRKIDANRPPPIPPAQAEHPPTSGLRKAVFPLSEGDVIFLFPDGMTEDGIEELEAYLAVFLKKEKRKGGSHD